jgi:membrane-associated phospholipid phosphatase
MFVFWEYLRTNLWLALAICLDVLVAILVSGRLAVTLAVLVLLMSGALLVARLIVNYVYPFLDSAAGFLLRWARSRDNSLAQMLRNILEPSSSELPLLAILIVALTGGIWAFFGVLEDVATGDPLVVIDKVTYQHLLKLRSYWGDYGLVAITQLGDAQVVIPVATAGLAVLLALGRWRAAKYLVIAFVGAAIWVELIKLLLQRSRPADLYDGPSQFSFPSGHATMSIVLFGFLAILLAHGASPQLRRTIISTALTLILLIGFSRIYLGAHWFSDVLAGLSFGVAWVALLAIAYFRVAPAPLPGGPLSAILVAVLVASGAFHVARSHATDMSRYAVLRGSLDGSAPATKASEFWKQGHR